MESLIPYSRYYISKTEWEFWFSEQADDHPGGWMPEFARKKLSPIEEMVIFLDKDGEILPEVSVLFSPGHTPGHMVVSFSSQNERLLFIGDVALHPMHLKHPDWYPIFDVIPEAAIASKQRIFDLAAESGCWVMAQQFPPFPSLGHVVKKDTGWEWQPIVKH